MVDFEALKAEFPREAISWRAQNVTQDGSKAMALAYIDARDVMDRLDAVCGPAGWQCKYSHANGKTVCDIGIYAGGLAFTDGKEISIQKQHEWIWKADGAGDSDIEAEKGALSDAFKRAAVRWGIGRYLYAIASPWVPCESYKSGDKYKFKKFTDDPWKFVSAPLVTEPKKAKEPAKEAASYAERYIGMLQACKTLDALNDILENPQHEERVKKLASKYSDLHSKILTTLEKERARLVQSPVGQAA